MSEARLSVASNILYCVSDKMFDEIKSKVSRLLGNEKSGHSDEHIFRVYELAMQFAEKEKANKEIVAVAALLHDVDDYKLFGAESAKNLVNARKIMSEVKVPVEVAEPVCEIISSMGYSKLLAGVRPKSIEGKIVSDADMCDGIGAIGILRWHQYIIAHNGVVFNPDIFPVESISAEEYKKQCASCGDKLVGGNPVNHYFDKLLKLSGLMLSKSGEIEAKKRQQIMVDFLYEYFRENNAPKWKKVLDDFLSSKEAKK
ncbi:phosphohydrolase [Clostridia bacterium]|nr:phosphohydrolase [Clostridia bacterium]